MEFTTHNSISGTLAENAEAVKAAILSFMDYGMTDKGRGTYYNTAVESDVAVANAHGDLMALHRGLYSLALALPGMTDRTRLNGVMNMLSNPWSEVDSFLTPTEEDNIVRWVLDNTPVHRALKIFGRLREKRVNNRKTRRAIMRYILNSDRIELWGVRYKTKLKTAIEHALGKRTASYVAAIAGKIGRDKDITQKETGIFQSNIMKNTTLDRKRVANFIRFVFGDDAAHTHKLFKAYREAKRDITRGKGLPLETLIGIVGVYHPETSMSTIIDLTKETMTKKQKVQQQATAERHGTSIEFDPSTMSPFEMLVYAYERGMDEELMDAFNKKVAQKSRLLNVPGENVAIIVDNSQSMQGPSTQMYHPIARATALARTMQHAFSNAEISVAGGELRHDMLHVPAGETSLTQMVAEAMVSGNYDHVYIISDGYDNAPEGRLHDAVEALRNAGVTIPVHQFAPVSSAEAKGVRPLSNLISYSAIGDAESMFTSMLRNMVSTDIVAGVEALVDATIHVARQEVLANA